MGSGMGLVSGCSGACASVWVDGSFIAAGASGGGSGACVGAGLGRVSKGTKLTPSRCCCGSKSRPASWSKFDLTQLSSHAQKSSQKHHDSRTAGWNGFNAFCSSRKKSAFVLPLATSETDACTTRDTLPSRSSVAPGRSNPPSSSPRPRRNDSAAPDSSPAAAHKTPARQRDPGSRAMI